MLAQRLERTIDPKYNLEPHRSAGLIYDIDLVNPNNFGSVAAWKRAMLYALHSLVSPFGVHYSYQGITNKDLQPELYASA